MSTYRNPKLLVLCTVSTGLDAVAEVMRRGFEFAAIVGLHPAVADPISISGYVDVADFARVSKTPFHYVRSYSLKADVDKSIFENINFDLIWVAGWQRLIPAWLIDICRLGVLGGHGSPDGIHGGRGRSPQNWALMLGCERFDLALFRITAGIDDGPVIAQKSFFYREHDDIRISYYRASLAMADMICEILNSPERLNMGVQQPAQGYYYPQRQPEDGLVDWSLPRNQIVRHCRALTNPYPGLKSFVDGNEIILWECVGFDDVIESEYGTISLTFYSGEFLVNCQDGRVLVRKWSSSNGAWQPKSGMSFTSFPFIEQISRIVHRHEEKYPNLPISRRIKRLLR